MRARPGGGCANAPVRTMSEVTCRSRKPGRSCSRSRNPKGTVGMALAFLFPRKVSERVMYPWPIGDFDNAMDEALDIAMDYLERTGQAVKFTEVQRAAAMAIVAAWKAGVRRRIKLAHVAIKAVEPKAEPYLNPKLYRRRS